MRNFLAVDWSPLPAPQDDGAVAHMRGARLTSLVLPATDGRAVDLSALSGRTVLYVYPLTGRPDRPLPAGWDSIPGARGCTPQSCAFRDHWSEMQALGVKQLFGLSTQDTEYQKEAADRNHLPFPLVSDAELRFATAHRLPTFEVEGMVLLKRMSFVVDDGVVSHVLYPIFPPDQNAQRVLEWLAAERR